MLNMSETGGLTYQESLQYVTIESCKAVMEQTAFWMYLLGILFLLSWIAFCYVLMLYLKQKRLNTV